jgi:protein-L-isoaspartate O-methyltransferase
MAEVLDLGPAIGPNIAFLGERIGCKIHVKDLYADLERHAQADTLAELPELLKTSLSDYKAETIDAVLCWDIFDYLAAPAAGVLAATLVEALRPGGALLALFGGGSSTEPGYTRYVIEDERHLRYRVTPAACARQRPLQNREILALLPGLSVFDSVLLKSGVREMLFRKPEEL